jgi:hypothetical protein
MVGRAQCIGGAIARADIAYTDDGEEHTCASTEKRRCFHCGVYDPSGEQNHASSAVWKRTMRGRGCGCCSGVVIRRFALLGPLLLLFCVLPLLQLVALRLTSAGPGHCWLGSERRDQLTTVSLCALVAAAHQHIGACEGIPATRVRVLPVHAPFEFPVARAFSDPH